MFNNHPELDRIGVKIRDVDSRYPPIMRMGISVDEMIYLARRLKGMISTPALDLMCGNCLISVLLSKMLNTKVHAIDDWSQFPIERAKKNILEDSADVELLTLKSLDDPLPFESSYFNTVFSVMYLSNIRSEKRIRLGNEISRVLKENGKFIVVDTMVFRTKIRRDLEGIFKLEWYGEENGFSFFLFRKLNSNHA